MTGRVFRFGSESSSENHRTGLFRHASIEHAQCSMLNTVYLIKIELNFNLIGLHDSLHMDNSDAKWNAKKKKRKTEP